MARSVAFYLTRFDEEPKIAAVAAPVLVEEAAFVQEDAPPPAIVLSDEIREQLIEEGRAAAETEYRDQIERERTGFNEHLESERRRWTSEEGERLGETFRAALADLTNGLEANLARLLEPFVVEEIRAQMLADLIARLRTALADRENPIVHLSGPMDLLEVVCSTLAGHEIATSVVEVGGVDVKARVDSTSIETRLREWIAQLRGESGGT